MAGTKQGKVWDSSNLPKGVDHAAIRGLVSATKAQVAAYLEGRGNKGTKEVLPELLAEVETAATTYLGKPNAKNARGLFAAAGALKERTRKISESEENGSGISKGAIKGSVFQPRSAAWTLKTRARSLYEGIEAGTLKVTRDRGAVRK